MRQGLAAIRATGAELRQPYYLALLAGACDEAGQVDSGLALLAEGLTEAHRHGECWQEAELHRLRGELLLRAGVHATRSHADGDAESVYAGAEQSFHQALVTARRQEAKSLELRAAVNLARLWQQKGNDAEARDLLAPVCETLGHCLTRWDRLAALSTARHARFSTSGCTTRLDPGASQMPS
jgi:predicted ATPase